MFTKHNYLQMYRKRSKLDQSDIAFIMKLSDYSNISRWEKGKRKPSLALLMIYNVLFGIPIDSLFEKQRRELVYRVRERVEMRIRGLKALPQTAKIGIRMNALERALERLINSQKPSA